MAEHDVKISPWVLRTAVSLIIIILAQSFLIVWWAASLSTTVDYIRADVFELKTELRNRIQNYYTLSNAHEDQSLHIQVHELITKRFQGMEARLSKVEK